MFWGQFFGVGPFCYCILCYDGCKLKEKENDFNSKQRLGSLQFKKYSK